MSPSTSPQDQFQALLHCQARGAWAELLDLAASGPAAELPEAAQALLWQLQAEAQLALGQRPAARHSLERSFALMPLPSSACQLLELVGLPPFADDTTALAAWLAPARWLLRAGHGAPLLELLHHQLQQLPLDQQRRELLALLPGPQALDLERDPQLLHRWQLLERLLA